MKRCVPLVCDVIELHRVAFVPVVETAAKLHFLMTRTSIVKHESLGDALSLNHIELRRNVLQESRLLFGLFSTKVDVV